MILKIIRTIIGLPFALIIWPLAIWSAIFGVSITLIIKGKLEWYETETAIEMLTVPYQFIKKVWVL